MEISDYKKQKSTELWQRTRNQNATRILMQITKRWNYDQANYKKAIRIILQISGGFEIWWRLQKEWAENKGSDYNLGNEMSIHAAAARIYIYALERHH